MPRCAICDFAPIGDTSADRRRVSFDKKEQKFVCSVCNAAISDALGDFTGDDEIHEDFTVERHELLDKRDMEEYRNKIVNRSRGVLGSS